MDKERVSSNQNNRDRNGARRTEGQSGRDFRRNGTSFHERGGASGRNRDSYRTSPRRGQGGSHPYDKDKDADYERKDMHRRNAASSREKPREQTTDKMEVVKRLEKEKKAMQKKNQGKKNQQSRPQVRVKRTNNIDWTKEYENDSYDDDDMYYDFR